MGFIVIAERDFSRNGRSRMSDLKAWLNLHRLPSLGENILPVDNRAIWRRHLAWAKCSGKQLRENVVQRFGTNMVFMSVLMSTALAVLFSPADVTTIMRNNLKKAPGFDDTVQLVVGLFLILAIFLALFAMIATFSAWAVVSSLGDSNVHTVTRSSIGLYATQLPSRLISCTIVSFVMWNVLWLYVLLPTYWWATAFTILFVLVYFHIVSTYSSFARIVMHTSAMAQKAVIPVDQADEMMPYDLNKRLIRLAREEQQKKESVTKQYREQRKSAANFSPANGHRFESELDGGAAPQADNHRSVYFEEEVSTDASPQSIVK